MRHRFNKRKILFIIPMALAGLAFFGWLVELLWNGILAEVVHVSPVNFWQALGILVLCKILFGGFRGGYCGRRHWRKEIMQNWDKMTPEEKEKFKQEWQNRCGQRFGKKFGDQNPGGHE